ncbi:MAG: hypothetical protein KIS87_05040 [Phycisphaeraceae bacterium]|nr:hypothetical protein [Phycisphaeraceae bacterium]
MDAIDCVHDRPKFRFAGRAWTNGLLALIAVLVGAAILKQPPAVASASQDDEPRARGVVNPADQRNEMIRQLRSLNDRLGRVEKQLSDGVRVREAK